VIDTGSRIRDHLTFLYGQQEADSVWSQLQVLLSEFQERHPHLRMAAPPSRRLTERDAILITYADQFREAGVAPLHTLYQVLTETLQRPVSGVHILPFFPYSSDDGFSIIDYTEVNADFGTWQDVERLGRDFRLMVDAVVNHVSRHSMWFQRFLADDSDYADWFITVKPGTDLSMVVRPRALPLVHAVQTASGEKWVWTTFSEDQIDLNYAHPPVLLRMIEILLLYVAKGAQIIRLDAIAYAWKKIGTPCIHLPEAHRLVKLLRAVLDAVAPSVLLITETNVPHEENISYFGDPLPTGGGTDEAQMVYQFPLAPLVMHSILTADARVISQWCAGLDTPAPQATFFNFTASHDGVGVMPARGLLGHADIQMLVDRTLAHGGQVSFRTNHDGSQSVYELNVSYFDALSDPAGDEPLALQVQRFICSQAIMLALAGVPGIYVHSLLGSRSWQDGMAQTGRRRSINRQKLDAVALRRELADPTSLRHQVFNAYGRLLRARASEPAFHPYGGQQVLSLSDSVFALLRFSSDRTSRVLCLHNVSAESQPAQFGPSGSALPPGTWRDLLTGATYDVGADPLSVLLPPYAVRWLRI